MVFEACKSTKVLERNFEQVNMKKWHQPTKEAFRQSHLFSVRGFYLGITCEALCHNLFKSTGAPGGGKPAFVSTCDNQLVKAAREFNELDNWYSENLIAKCCQWIGAAHSVVTTILLQ